MKNLNTKHKTEQNFTIPDPIALSQALMDAYEKAQPLLQDYMKNNTNDLGEITMDPLNVRKAWQDYMESLAENPQKFWQDQMEFWKNWNHLVQSSTQKFFDESANSDPIIEPGKGDRRFRAPEWQESAIFDFIKQSYLLTCQAMEKSVDEIEGLDKVTKQKLTLSNRLFADAISPTNFIMTNPEVLAETMKTGGNNLVKGFQNLLEDLKRGEGKLKISTTDYKAFKLGENIATTKGEVVYQNDLIQLIQYAPTTKQVHKRPLLIVPPWINKYYILDLRADNSYVKWAVDKGHTVFIVSWVNPNAELAQKQFEDYMQDGLIAALDTIKDITNEPDCNVVGYCLGGTLLTTALAYLADKGEEKRVASATFLTTLIDFENSGEMKLFMDDTQLELMEKQMSESGVLQAKQLQQTFSLLRANDLIWSFVVNNYLMGREPFPFDLLYWNDDSTNMPAATHKFYLRNMYRDNKLVKAGGITLKDTPIDIGKIRTPCYFLSTKEDHIAPWKATYATTQISGSKDMTFTLAASGHIAGVVNPPIKEKYCFWTNNKTPNDPDDWFKEAKENKGSWWGHWEKWLQKHSGGMVKAREPKHSLEPAPGSYVEKKA